MDTGNNPESIIPFFKKSFMCSFFGELSLLFYFGEYTKNIYLQRFLGAHSNSDLLTTFFKIRFSVPQQKLLLSQQLTETKSQKIREGILYMPSSHELTKSFFFPITVNIRYYFIFVSGIQYRG